MKKKEIIELLVGLFVIGGVIVSTYKMMCEGPSDYERRLTDCKCSKYYELRNETKQEYFKRMNFTQAQMTEKTVYNDFAQADAPANVAWSRYVSTQLDLKESCFKAYTFETYNYDTKRFYRENVSFEEVEKRAKRHCETGEKNKNWG